ncbi:FitA-like ribbon-helix-helix domain-containing protein [Asaia sp. BMEF1]|uniref:FitA-like ribbon-helix-helix domain-containing protein n=1 Tax=Asaia sp. BMEF1 TaxID=3155932 RepID=UPI003F6728CD
MTDTASLTIRVDRALLRALKVRAVMNDRSSNKEITAILRDVLKTKKTEEAQPGSKPSSVSE